MTEKTAQQKTQAMEVELANLSYEAIRDIARNGAANSLWRRAAVKKLVDDNHAYANHPDLELLVEMVKAETAPRKKFIEVESKPEVKKEEHPGLRASVTTKTLYND